MADRPSLTGLGLINQKTGLPIVPSSLHNGGIEEETPSIWNNAPASQQLRNVISSPGSICSPYMTAAMPLYNYLSAFEGGKVVEIGNIQYRCSFTDGLGKKSSSEGRTFLQGGGF